MITNTNGNKRKVNGDVVGTTPGDVIEFTLLRGPVGIIRSTSGFLSL